LDEYTYKLESALHIPDQKILHDFAILRMSKMDSLPEDDHELLIVYNSTVSELVEFYNHYKFGK
jgi:hypothetical protein